MKFLYFVTIVCLWQNVQCDIRYPRPIKLVWLYPEPDKIALKITWEPVKNWDEQDPVTGYKLVFWEMYTFKYDEKVVTFPDSYENSFPSEFAKGPPQIFEVPASNRTVVIADIKPDVWYEYSVLAFTKKGEGPLSTPASIKYVGRNKKKP